MNLFDRQVDRYAQAVIELKTGDHNTQVRAADRMESITNIVVRAGIAFDPFLEAVDRRITELEDTP